MIIVHSSLGCSAALRSRKLDIFLTRTVFLALATLESTEERLLAVRSMASMRICILSRALPAVISATWSSPLRTATLRSRSAMVLVIL